MKAWTLVGPKQLNLITQEPSVLTAENNVKVKMEQVLFATTEYSMYETGVGKKGSLVLGRNGVGVVSETYDAKALLNKMDRVVIEPYVACNACTNCKEQNYQDCESMKELGVNAGGLLQDFVDLPASILHKLPDSLSTERALFVPTVATCLNVVDSLQITPGMHVAVFASTKSGLIVAQLLSHYQALPVLISDNNEIIEIARSLNVYYTINTNDCDDVAREVQVITGTRMCKNVVYFADSSFNMREVYSVASFNAKVCLVGYGAKESKVSVAQIAIKHLTIFGVYNGCGKFPRAINLLVTESINVDFMVGEKIAFDNLGNRLLKVVDADEFDVHYKIVAI